MNQIRKAFLLFIAVLFIGCSKHQTNPDEKIVILYTNDIHCGIENNIGFAGLKAYKDDCLSQTPYVITVDCGDAVQGDLVGTVSEGSFIVDLMNAVHYDYAIFGNHEFDYNLNRLSELIKKSEAKYLSSNIEYSGKKVSFLEDTLPFAIKECGKTKVAFIGISTPMSITASTPAYFMENDKFVYDFGESDDKFVKRVQKAVNKARSKGADYVIALAHLGIEESCKPFRSVDLIEKTYGIDAVLDGHSHSVVSCETYTNKKGLPVILSQTGSKFENIGELTIATDGTVSSKLVSDYEKKDEGINELISSIKSSYASLVEKVVAHSDIPLYTKDSNGARMVRNRETIIGNLCADAYRAVALTDIGFVNGGGIRSNLPEGDISYADIISVHPFGNMLCSIKTTGSKILDCLELSCCNTKSVSAEGGQAVGESGGFLSVSGLKFTIDTSVPTPVVLDDKGLFVKIEGERRVKDVMVLNGDSYVPLDPDGVYTVASHNYMIKDGGDGFSMFKDEELLIDCGMLDNQVLITYLTDILEGNISAKYSKLEGRITVK